MAFYITFIFIFRKLVLNFCSFLITPPQYKIGKGNWKSDFKRREKSQHKGKSWESEDATFIVCRSFSANSALKWTESLVQVSWMALECNWPGGTLTSHPGFDKMLHSVLGDEGQSLNKQTVSMVGFKERFVFIISKSGNDTVFSVSPLRSCKVVSTDLHPVHGFPDLVKVMSRAEGL